MDRQLTWLGLVGLGIAAAASSCGGDLKLPNHHNASSSSGNGGAGGMSSSSGMGGEGGAGGMVEPPPGEALFADNQIIGINIKLSLDAANALSVDPSTYVQADVDITMNGTTTTIPKVGVRIKGKAGSLRTLDQKAAFVIKFNEYTKGQKLDGLTKLAVNNMVQDSSMIHERLGYVLFNAMELPSARSGYARVSVNGALYGLYSTVESASNNEFLERWFGGADGNLYEGAYGTDVEQGSYQGFDQDNGMPVGLADVAALVAALDKMDPQNFMVEAPKIIDMDRYIEFAATEIYIGHWDGYANYRNNYFIYQRPDNKLWTWIPWGIDQTFSDHMDAFVADSRMQILCVQSIPCRQKLADAYAKVMTKVNETKLIAKATEVKNLIWAEVQADPRKETDSAGVSWSIEQTIEFLKNRQATLEAGLVCVDPSNIDMDMDGSFGCGIDCDDNNPNVYPGAQEQCNFIDDDCNGILDDQPQCPKCKIVPDVNGGNYAYCVEPNSWFGAELDCQAQGGHLVSIHNLEEFQTISTEAEMLGIADFWIGFNDRAVENKFAWSDGTPADFELWNPGEPNDYGAGEDCTQVYAGNGTWNDLDCDAGLLYVCKLP
jgi:CotH kinase protein/Lectin C-type domain/Putative metal-binding motif